MLSQERILFALFADGRGGAVAGENDEVVRQTSSLSRIERKIVRKRSAGKIRAADATLKQSVAGDQPGDNWAAGIGSFAARGAGRMRVSRRKNVGSTNRLMLPGRVPGSVNNARGKATPLQRVAFLDEVPDGHHPAWESPSHPACVSSARYSGRSAS